MSRHKKKIGGCKKKLHQHKVSKGLRRSIAKPFGKPPASHGARAPENATNGVRVYLTLAPFSSIIGSVRSLLWKRSRSLYP